MDCSVYVLLPTFKEPRHVDALLADLAAQNHPNLHIGVVNSNPRDETSELLCQWSQQMSVLEIEADPSLYWTGAMAKGLAWVMESSDTADYVLFMNCDVRITADFLSRLLVQAEHLPNSVLAPAVIYGDRFASCGAVMRSWFFALSDPILKGLDPTCSDNYDPIPADMLPARALLFPASLLQRIGGLRPALLPHYGADYEFTRRAALAGYRLFVLPSIRVAGDPTNTGPRPWNLGTTLRQRIALLSDIKSVINMKYSLRLVYATYPLYALPSALILTAIKCLVVACCGSFRRSGTGHSA